MIKDGQMQALIRQCTGKEFDLKGITETEHVFTYEHQHYISQTMPFSRLFNLFIVFVFLASVGCSDAQVKEPSLPTPEQIADFSLRTGLRVPASAKILYYFNTEAERKDASYYIAMRIDNDDFQSIIDSLSIGNRKLYSQDAPGWITSFEASQRIPKNKKPGYIYMTGERIYMTINEGFDRSYVYISSF